MIRKALAVITLCASLALFRTPCQIIEVVYNPAVEKEEQEKEMQPIVIDEPPVPDEIQPVQEETKRNKLDNVRLTHYCICEKCCGKTPDHPAYGITASGRGAVPYFSVAVDPNVIPLGSNVWLEYSDGRVVECRADDTGEAIVNARIDLCVSSHTEALELGIAYITVYWEVKENETLQ